MVAVRSTEDNEESIPSACPHAFLHDGYMDFLHIGYYDKVPWTADARKIEFGFVPNLTNYGIFFHKF